MIKGIHALFYTSQDEALRAFFRDQMKLPYTDVGGGWLIFDVAEGDLGVHPTDGGEPASGTHAVSFYCTTPSGFRLELAASCIKVEPGAWKPTSYDYFSMWGHRVVA